MVPTPKLLVLTILAAAACVGGRPEVLVAPRAVGTVADRPGADAAGPAADVVVAWNDLALAIAEAEDRFLTLKGLRTVTLMHLAIHDALVAIDRRYLPYLSDVDLRASDVGVGEADPLAAANAAAFAVVVSQYPDARPALEAERERWDLPAAEARTEVRTAVAAGRALGERAATAILEARRDDGWDAEAAYEWRPIAPGVYAQFSEHSGTPEDFVFGAGWARARPFVMDGPGQFRSPPPPAIDSEAYARAFDEVRRVGARHSAVRTADQTHLAMWWKEFVEKSHNRLARVLVLEDQLGLWAAARLFALLNMSIYDGYVASFDSKFHYNHWRPYTAIRWASKDGNPATIEDAGWTNLHDHTYAFPSYPSAHGSVCAAAMTVLASVFGAHRAFTMTTHGVDAAGPLSPKVPMEPPTRSFEDFAEAAEECAVSRVYLGIHFRYDSVAGTVLGRQVGERAVQGFLKPQMTRPTGSY